MTRRLEALMLAYVSLSACWGCGSESSPLPPDQIFPNRRAKFPSEGRTLGYVANRNSDSVSVIDLDGLRELGQLPVGVDPVDIDGPRHIAIDAQRRVAYVLLTFPFSVPSAHLAASGTPSRQGYVQALDLLDFAQLGELHVDKRASDIALSADGERISVTHFDRDLSISTGDLETRRSNLALLAPAWGIQDNTARVERRRLCVAPAAHTYSNRSARVHIACTGEDSLVTVDATSGEVLSRVPAGADVVNKPMAIVMDSEESRLLVSNQFSSAVVSFSADATPVLQFSTPSLEAQPMNAGYISRAEFIVTLQLPSGAARVDAETGAVLTRVSYTDVECSNPTDVAKTADGRIFLVCEGDHYAPGALIQIDPASLTVLRKTTLGIFPERLAILPP